MVWSKFCSRITLFPMVYHVYHPTVQGEARCGYYFREAGRKTCVIKHPRTGQKFRNDADVERWLDELRSREVAGSTATVSELGRYLFLPDGPWAQRQARRRDGHPLSPQTLREHELNARRHILPAIGRERVCDVDTQMIDELLYALDLSNRSRRNVAGTLQAILKEGVRRRIIRVLPPIELPDKKSRKPAVLTLDQLRALFPRSRKELMGIWEPAGTHPEAPAARLALAACAATMFFGGLRPQEARAARPDQYPTELRKLGIFLVMRSMDSEGRVKEYLKMGDERDRRYRGTLLIDWAKEMLELWLRVRPRRPYLFTYDERPIRAELLRARLAAAAEKAGIQSKGRRIIPYSGRYTFNSSVKPFLPQEVLMTLMGHVDAAMPERYDVPVLIERMKQLAPHRENINKAIG